MSTVKSHGNNGSHFVTPASRMPTLVPPTIEVPTSVVDPAPQLPVRDVYLERFMEAAGRLRMELRFVTPELARQWLDEVNTGNRPLRFSWRKLRDIIGRGGWFVTGECLLFDNNGHLLNGQHRLKAICESGEPVPICIIYGLSTEVFAVLDRTSVRTNADTLAIEKIKNSSTMAAALSWQYRYDQSPILRQGCMDLVPADLLIPTLHDHPGMAESVEYVKGTKSKRVPPGSGAFLHYQFSLRNAEATKDFFLKVLENVGIEQGSHHHLLVRRLDNDMSGRRSQGDQIEIMALIIKTWNRILENEAPGRIVQWKRSLGEVFPTILPELE